MTVRSGEVVCVIRCHVISNTNYFCQPGLNSCRAQTIVSSGTVTSSALLCRLSETTMSSMKGVRSLLRFYWKPLLAVLLLVVLLPLPLCTQKPVSCVIFRIHFLASVNTAKTQHAI